jgi:hypothetical protein
MKMKTYEVLTDKELLYLPMARWSKKDREIGAAIYTFYCLLSIGEKFDSLVP